MLSLITHVSWPTNGHKPEGPVSNVKKHLNIKMVFLPEWNVSQVNMTVLIIIKENRKWKLWNQPRPTRDLNGFDPDQNKVILKNCF